MTPGLARVHCFEGGFATRRQGLGYGFELGGSGVGPLEVGVALALALGSGGSAIFRQA